MEKINYTLYGGGGHAKVISNIILEDKNAFIQYFDIEEKEFLGLYLGVYDSSVANQTQILIAIGDNKARKNISKEISHSYFKTFHSSAIIDPTVKIGMGSVVMQAAVIQADSIIGAHVIINTKASVDHDCKIGNFCHVAPGVTICGGVTISEGVFIGAGATILPGVTIGKWSVVGAGATVTKDVRENTTVVGTPAKKIKEL